ncbi:hypothetical protein NDU88_000176 [Pleurodeles waltl]|uniref:Uncharacterized protein n=1 Tax=Pleurodeles waltl TaxID=8319 RepID=A0AAV7P050_PLEWA|nr:hypothetical protein NDU88_000176 [Pleurodeles waltl]
MCIVSGAGPQTPGVLHEDNVDWQGRNKAKLGTYQFRAHGIPASHIYSKLLHSWTLWSWIVGSRKSPEPPTSLRYPAHQTDPCGPFKCWLSSVWVEESPCALCCLRTWSDWAAPALQGALSEPIGRDKSWGRTFIQFRLNETLSESLKK